MKMMIRAAVMSLLCMTLITGVVYPVIVTGLAQSLYPAQANGSLITRAGASVGSDLIGQSFDAPKYFWGRLSATAPLPYTAFNPDTLTGSSGSNLGPYSPALKAAAMARLEALRQADPGNTAPVPVDLVTASGSGLDPHISPEAAEYQVARVARARGIDAAKVADLTRQYTEGRTLGLLGEARVNVLRLNLALDGLR